MARMLVLAFAFLLFADTATHAQESRTVYDIEFLDDRGRVTGSSSYASLAEAQAVLGRIRQGNRNLGWGDVKAQIVTRQIQPDILGGRTIWPEPLPEAKAADEEAVAYVERLLAETELSELERTRASLQREKLELESLRDSIVRDTNGLLSEPEETKAALQSDLEKRTEEYLRRRRAYEAANATFTEDTRKFQQKKQFLQQTESKLGLAEAYTIGVISLRQQPEKNTNATESTNIRPESSAPVRREPANANANERSNQTKLAFLRSSWKSSYANSQQGAGRVESIVISGDQVKVNFWRDRNAYSYSGFIAAVEIDGTTVRLRSSTGRQQDVTFEGTLMGDRLEGFTTIGSSRTATTLYRK